MEYWSDTRTLQRHNHLLRLACDAPASSEFFAALHVLVNYAIDNMLDYHGPPTKPPQSVAHVAADENNPDVALARDQIEITRDEMMAVCMLASYLLGDGNPSNNPGLDRYPRQTLVQPVPLDTPGPLNPVPAQPPPSVVGSVAAMSHEQRRVLRMDARCKLILATANRCYHDSPRHGCVLTALFLSLATRVPEVTAMVRAELSDEGLTDAQQTLMLRYMTGELHSLCLYPMSYENAATLWTTWWHTVTHVLRTNSFADAERAIRTREEQRLEDIRMVHEETKKKREQRGRAKMRRRKKQMTQEEDIDDMAGVSDDDLVDDVRELSSLARRASSAPPGADTSDIHNRIGELASSFVGGDDDDDDLSDLLQ